MDVDLAFYAKAQKKSIPLLPPDPGQGWKIDGWIGRWMDE